MTERQKCPECPWCALYPNAHGECDCPPHECGERALIEHFSPDKQGEIA